MILSLWLMVSIMTTTDGHFKPLFNQIKIWQGRVLTEW
jgi:hypothetical protein